MTEREGPITELGNHPSSLFFLLFALRASILLPLFCVTLLLVFSFFLYHFPLLIHFIPAQSIKWFWRMCRITYTTSTISVISFLKGIILREANIMNFSVF